MAYRAHTVGRLVRLVLAWTWAGAAADRSCSQYPGFAEYFAEHLRSSPPTKVIRRWRAAMRRASICLPDTRVRCDFYRDHIAHGCLVTGNGVRIEGPTPAEPNRPRDDPLAEFAHVPGGSDAPHPVVYASVERTELWAPRDAGGTAEEFIVATYHLVFRASDLPARLPAAAEASLGLVANPDDRHQLDHYTAAFVVLDAGERPVALTLQQHSYLRTCLVGETVEPGGSGQLDLDVAIRSNELYPR